MKKLIITLLGICLSIIVYAQADTVQQANAQKINELRDKLNNLKQANSATQNELNKNEDNVVTPTLIHRLKVLDENITIISAEINKLELLMQQMAAQQEQLTRIESKLDNLLNQSAKLESIVTTVTEQGDMAANANNSTNKNNNNSNSSTSNKKNNKNNANGSGNLTTIKNSNPKISSYKEGVSPSDGQEHVILSGSYYIVVESQVRKSDAKIAQEMLKEKGVETMILKHNTRGWHYLVVENVLNAPQSLEKLETYRGNVHPEAWRVPIEYVHQVD